MKKFGYYSFMMIALLICVFPLAGMSFARTEETTEKRQMAEFPTLIQEEGWNKKYLQELGAYFEDHFAFRESYVAIDSWMESILFQQTNIDNVIVGTEGWLFYKDTLNDYAGKEIMSDQSLENIAYNISVMQRMVEAQGKKFVFTIAPNKNSLYEQNMPYTYSYKYSDNSNRKLLEKKLWGTGVNYVDLYEQFENQKEILYFKRDSHWNNKGALLAYNSILDEAEWPHEDYSYCRYSIKNDYIGDLNSMVYPKMEKSETNYYYDYKTLYQYVNQGKYEAVDKSSVSVEDARIQTYNEKGKGTLVIYRDSFGNTLLPFMANAFKNGYFYKTTPYNLGMHIEYCNPDVVIVEKVERKLDELATTPAVMSGVEIALPEKCRTVHTNTTLDAAIPEANMEYYEIYGVLDKEVAGSSEEIYIQFDAKAGEKITYQAFARTIEGVSDYGYVAYIPSNLAATKEMEVNVYIKRKDDVFCVKTSTIDVETITQKSDSITEDDIIVSDATKTDAKEIEITISEQGKEKVIRTEASTLQEMASRGEITLNDEDRIIPERNDALIDGEVVSIQRVVIKEKKERKKIPFKTKEVLSDQLYEGESKVTKKGKNGRRTIVYRMTYVDGKLEKKEKISEKVTKKPVNKIISKGTKEKVVEASTPAYAPKNTGSKTVVSREWVEDCGLDSGYYIITYSDGSVEYVDG